MRRNADMPDLTLLFGLQQPLVKPVWILRIGQISRIMQLIKVDIVCFEHLQTGFQVLHQPRFVLCRRLGSDVDVLAHIAQSIADLLLTVGIAARRIEKIDPRVIGFA